MSHRRWRRWKKSRRWWKRWWRWTRNEYKRTDYRSYQRNINISI